jgi:hypothetical protein
MAWMLEIKKASPFVDWLFIYALTKFFGISSHVLPLVFFQLFSFAHRVIA